MGSDPCVQGNEPCKFCVALTPEQILKLVIPKCKIRKEKKVKSGKVTGLLGSAVRCCS